MQNDSDRKIQDQKSNGSIMTVGELIDNAFGEPEVNVVHHKLLQSVLYLLARQLRVLERRVSVNISPGITHGSPSTLSVTEVKLQSTTKTKNKGDSSSKDKTLSDKKGRTPADKTTSDRTSAEKSSPDKTSKVEASREIISKDKKRTEKILTADKVSTKRSVSPSTDMASTKQPSSDETSLQVKRSMSLQDYQKLLETLEETRERELRNIHQRTDSREEHDKTPSPMASLDSVEATYEKLLVERISSEEADMKASARGKTSTRKDAAPRISVVTQEQFDDLAYIVNQIQEKLGPISTPGFPENAQLLHELRKGASLTDAMAALQLSARLEATEKTLKTMLSLVTDLAQQTPATDNQTAPSENIEEVHLKEPSTDKGHTKKKHGKSTKKGPPSPPIIQSFISEPLPHSDTSMKSPQQRVMASGTDESKEVIKEHVTYEDMQTALQELRDEVMRTVNTTISRSTANADVALKLTAKLEGKLQAALDLGDRMINLESLVSNYAEQINVLDTGLSSQMTKYQEELTQMQHDLESGLENMAEMMADTGGEATAVAELNAHFNDLQSDIDNTVSRQKDLKDIQRNLSVDLESLRRQIEVLREVKSDREEVVDALRDKAGIGALNGLVSAQQFDAVQGDFEKRIGAAYDKFNNQEMVWQRAFEDFLTDLNEKADVYQVEGLRDEINRHLENMRVKMNYIIDIVGEPSAAALSKKLKRDTACLSCSAPAQMKLEEPSGTILPALRPPPMGAEAHRPKGDGDHGKCIPGFPIPHPRDPRTHICNRWCGGSHTVLTTPISRAPPGMIITSANLKVNMELGPDGRMYAVDKPHTLKPCWQCNEIPPPSPESPETEEKQQSTDMPYHLCPHFIAIGEDMGSTTPAVSSY